MIVNKMLLEKDIVEEITSETPDKAIVSVKLLQKIVDELKINQDVPTTYFELDFANYTKYFNGGSKSCYYTVRGGICELTLNVYCKEGNSTFTPLKVFGDLPSPIATKQFMLVNKDTNEPITAILRPNTATNRCDLELLGGTLNTQNYRATIHYMIK